MISFFRRFRQKLISGNNFSKYLFYAIGEIVLVVIGILIALYINNWNTIKQQKETEQIYLQSLKNEFQYNLKLIEENIESNKVFVNSISSLLTLFDPDYLDNTSENEIAQLIGPLSTRIIYNPSKDVLTEIISSGNLRLIRNSDLRQKLAAFDNALESIKGQEFETSKIRTELLKNLNDHGSFKNLLIETGVPFKGTSRFRSHSNKQLFSALSFENNLLLMQQMSQTTNNYFYSKLKHDIEEILDIINNESNN